MDSLEDFLKVQSESVLKTFLDLKQDEGKKKKLESIVPSSLVKVNTFLNSGLQKYCKPTSVVNYVHHFNPQEAKKGEKVIYQLQHEKDIKVKDTLERNILFVNPNACSTDAEYQATEEFLQDCSTSLEFCKKVLDTTVATGHIFKLPEDKPPFLAKLLSIWESKTYQFVEVDPQHRNMNFLLPSRKGGRRPAGGDKMETSGSYKEASGSTDVATGDRMETSGSGQEVSDSHMEASDSHMEASGSTDVATGDRMETSGSGQEASGSTDVATSDRMETSESGQEPSCSGSHPSFSESSFMSLSSKTPTTFYTRLLAQPSQAKQGFRDFLMFLKLNTGLRDRVASTGLVSSWNRAMFERSEASSSQKDASDDNLGDDGSGHNKWTTNGHEILRVNNLLYWNMVSDLTREKILASFETLGSFDKKELEDIYQNQESEILHIIFNDPETSKQYHIYTLTPSAPVETRILFLTRIYKQLKKHIPSDDTKVFEFSKILLLHTFFTGLLTPEIDEFFAGNEIFSAPIFKGFVDTICSNLSYFNPYNSFTRPEGTEHHSLLDFITHVEKDPDVILASLYSTDPRQPISEMVTCPEILLKGGYETVVGRQHQTDGHLRHTTHDQMWQQGPGQQMQGHGKVPNGSGLEMQGHGMMPNGSGQHTHRPGKVPQGSGPEKHGGVPQIPAERVILGPNDVELILPALLLESCGFKLQTTPGKVFFSFDELRKRYLNETMFRNIFYYGMLEEESIVTQEDPYQLSAEVTKLQTAAAELKFVGTENDPNTILPLNTMFAKLNKTFLKKPTQHFASADINTEDQPFDLEFSMVSYLKDAKVKIKPVVRIFKEVRSATPAPQTVTRKELLSLSAEYDLQTTQKVFSDLNKEFQKISDNTKAEEILTKTYQNHENNTQGSLSIRLIPSVQVPAGNTWFLPIYATYNNTPLVKTLWKSVKSSQGEEQVKTVLADFLAVSMANQTWTKQSLNSIVLTQILHQCGMEVKYLSLEGGKKAVMLKNFTRDGLEKALKKFVKTSDPKVTASMIDTITEYMSYAMVREVAAGGNTTQVPDNTVEAPRDLIFELETQPQALFDRLDPNFIAIFNKYAKTGESLRRYQEFCNETSDGVLSFFQKEFDKTSHALSQVLRNGTITEDVLRDIHLPCHDSVAAFKKNIESEMRNRNGNMSGTDGNLGHKGGNMSGADGNLGHQGGNMSGADGNLGHQGGNTSPAGTNMSGANGYLGHQGGNMTPSGENMSGTNGYLGHQGGNMSGADDNTSPAGTNMSGADDNLGHQGGNRPLFGGNGETSTFLPFLKSFLEKIDDKKTEELRAERIKKDLANNIIFRDRSPISTIPNLQIISPAIRRQFAYLNSACAVNMPPQLKKSLMESLHNLVEQTYKCQFYMIVFQTVNDVMQVVRKHSSVDVAECQQSYQEVTEAIIDKGEREFKKLYETRREFENQFLSPILSKTGAEGQIPDYTAFKTSLIELLGSASIQKIPTSEDQQKDLDISTSVPQLQPGYSVYTF